MATIDTLSVPNMFQNDITIVIVSIQRQFTKTTSHLLIPKIEQKSTLENTSQTCQQEVVSAAILLLSSPASQQSYDYPIEEHRVTNNIDHDHEPSRVFATVSIAAK